MHVPTDRGMLLAAGLRLATVELSRLRRWPILNKGRRVENATLLASPTNGEPVPWYECR